MSDLLRAKRSPLHAVKQSFIASISEIPGADAGQLLDRIHFARSLRELWHLRAEVFNVVALRYGEAEADTRLAQLNRHFPKRAARTGYGALATRPGVWP